MSMSDEIRYSAKKMENGEKVVLPVYIAVDHSWSMGPQGNDAIDAANSLIPMTLDACAMNPLLDDHVRFSVIGFNNTAEVISRLARGTHLPMHTFQPSGDAIYSKMFELLRHQIAADAASLKADNFRTHRPTVFLVTDGEHTDDPSSAFAALTDTNWQQCPNISVIGVGKHARMDTISPYVSGKGRPFPTHSVAEATRVLEILLHDLLDAPLMTDVQDDCIPSSSTPDGKSEPEDVNAFDDYCSLTDESQWDENSPEYVEFLKEISF